MVTAPVAVPCNPVTPATRCNRCNGGSADRGAVTHNTAGLFRWCQRAGATAIWSHHQLCACMHAKPADTLARQHQHNRFMGLGVTAGIWPPSRITPGKQTKAIMQSHGDSTQNGQNDAKTRNKDTNDCTRLHAQFVAVQAPWLKCRRCGASTLSGWLCTPCTIQLWTPAARWRWRWARISYRVARWWWQF